MFARLTQLCSAALIAFALTAPSFAVAGDDGIVKVKSALPDGRDDRAIED